MASTNLEAVIRQNADNTERIMKNAIGYVVCNNSLGIAVQSTFDNSYSGSITRLITGVLVAGARSAVRDLDTTNDLAFLRIATRKFEYLVAPSEIFTIVVTARLEAVIRQNMDVTDRIMKNAMGFVVSNNALALTVHTTFDNASSNGIAKQIAGVLVDAARSAVRDLDTTNDLAFLRIATRKYELLIAPEEEFTITVMQ